ncbi:hypothetical protein [Oleiharenicola lentus]|uniref:hypothetical protein n=1 Tax=Oleiharenicola lentus TaxID=2508720 RepID=UPI003F67BE09
MNFIAPLTAAALAFLPLVSAGSQSKLVHAGPSGKLVYVPYNEAGDTVLDFSNCGYGGGGVPLPRAEEKIRLTASSANDDDTKRIQSALDEVAQLPLDADGFRGAVVLSRGTFRVSGTLKISANGVVLRGEGQRETDTVLLATGKKQRSLIEIHGSAEPKRAARHAIKITDRYVPVGTRSFTVEEASALRVGDRVYVDRVGNRAWISEIGMDRIAGRPGNESSTKQWTAFTLNYDRIITAIDGKRITVDAPIPCALDERWGGGSVVPYTDENRIERSGVENLRGDSEFDFTITGKDSQGRVYPADEAHALYLVSFDNAKNCWARDVTAVHFYHGLAIIAQHAKWITVQDSTSLSPVSKIDGGRRYPFYIEGQLSLILRCVSEGARHAFVLGARVSGPNAFVYGISRDEHATSEPHHRWSVGGLYDNVESDIAFQDRQWMGSGHGWAGANYVAWNTRGTLISQQPPTAQNFAVGHVGPKSGGAHPRADSHWESHGQHVEPESLYFKQLADRLK